jgi:hypothetical protein
MTHTTGGGARHGDRHTAYVRLTGGGLARPRIVEARRLRNFQ